MKNQSLRNYDIRGEYPEQLSKTDAFVLGLALARSRELKLVVVGYDMRPTSALLHDRFIDGLQAGGADVLDLGPATVDLVAFSVCSFEEAEALPEAGVMITGGRGDLSDTGFKIIGPDAAPVAPKEIEELIDVANHMDANIKHLKGKRIDAVELGLAGRYVKHMVRVLQTYGDWPATPERDPFKIVVSCFNYAQVGLFALIKTGLGVSESQIQVIPTNPDTQHPDPYFPPRAAQVRDEVITHKADLGICFDADGSGVRFFDKDGKAIHGAYSGSYIAAITAGRFPDAGVMADHRVVFPLINAANDFSLNFALAVPGSVPMRKAMRDGAATLGIETDGRFYFSEMFWSESAMMAAFIVTHLAYLSPVPIGEVVGGLSDFFRASEDTRFCVKDPQGIIDHFVKRLEPVANATKNPGEAVFRSKEPKLDWRAVLRISDENGDLYLSFEGQGIEASAYDAIHSGMVADILDLAKPEEAYPS